MYMYDIVIGLILRPAKPVYSLHVLLTAYTYSLLTYSLSYSLLQLTVYSLQFILQFTVYAYSFTDLQIALYSNLQFTYSLQPTLPIQQDR